MFGLGMGEVLIILVLALVLLGPQKLPDAAKQLGRGLRELRKATDDIKQQFESELKAFEEQVTSPPKPAPKPALAPGGTEKAAQEPSTPAPLAAPDNIPGLDAVRVEPAAAPPPSPDVVTRVS